eukprot:scaffold36274_cov125-Isochrysis_galbana.AAC.8
MAASTVAAPPPSCRLRAASSSVGTRATSRTGSAGLLSSARTEIDAGTLSSARTEIDAGPPSAPAALAPPKPSAMGANWMAYRARICPTLTPGLRAKSPMPGA